MKTIFFNVLLVYSLLTSCANFVYGDSTFSTQEIKKFQTGELNKLILSSNLTSIPQLGLTDIDGNIINFNLNDGKLRVLNFWALWCAPCRREMASLNKLQVEITSGDFEVIAIAAGRNNVSKINDFFTEEKLFHLKNFRDPSGQISNSLGILGLPTTLIIDSKGYEIGRVIGDINWISEDSVSLFEFLLKEQKF